MARETSKSVLRRMHQPGFATKYFVGHGLDIGAGNDSLSQYAEIFPLIETVSDWDVLHGDAQELKQAGDEWFDFVHSSHCLEHLDDPCVALTNWIRVVKPGGYLIILVPDEDLYEQGVWPSTMSLGHKKTFTVGKHESWSPESVNLLPLLMHFCRSVEVIKIERLEHTYRTRVDPPRVDQTQTPIGECAIEIILRKRGAPTALDVEKEPIDERYVNGAAPSVTYSAAHARPGEQSGSATARGAGGEQAGTAS